MPVGGRAVETRQTKRWRGGRAQWNAPLRKPSPGFLEQFEIGTSKHAVPADVGEEEVAGIGETRRNIPETEAAVFGPAGGGDERRLPLEPDVERERDALASEDLEEAFDKLRPLCR